MRLDYSERKPVVKNRPRKQPVGILTILFICAVTISFAMGLLTGRFIFKPTRKAAQDQPAVVADAAKGQSAPSSPAAPAQNPEVAGSKASESPLTFYETLPKGGKAVIGSGLNPKKSDPPPVMKPAASAPVAPQQQAGQKPQAPPAAAKPEERKEQNPAPADQGKKAAAGSENPHPPVPGKFCVQVASSQDRKEAEIIRRKMTEKGLTAFIVESNIKDKGTWYRVRIGKHLTQQAAGELAGKAGKGALVISE